jgi:6-phosphofructokinase 1
VSSHEDTNWRSDERGDCPGLNAVLRGVVLAAEKRGWEVVGFRDGFEGLLPPGDHVILGRGSTGGIMARGGTIIGTTNRGHFVAKVGAGNRTIVPSQVIADAKKILDELNVKALIIVGGDGSMATAQQLQEAGINCIGVPKTIDNDLEATATTLRHVPIADAVNRLRLVPPNGELVQTARDVDISFGD